MESQGPVCAKHDYPSMKLSLHQSLNNGTPESHSVRASAIAASVGCWNYLVRIGIPGDIIATLTAIKDVHFKAIMGVQLSEKDEEVLKYLSDITVADIMPEADEDGDEVGGFKLSFHFSENPFFPHSVLVRLQLSRSGWDYCSGIPSYVHHSSWGQ